jgi:hypothetical protein
MLINVPYFWTKPQGFWIWFFFQINRIFKNLKNWDQTWTQTTYQMILKY